jgi:hypothetical protein
MRSIAGERFISVTMTFSPSENLRHPLRQESEANSNEKLMKTSGDYSTRGSWFLRAAEQAPVVLIKK